MHVRRDNGEDDGQHYNSKSLLLLGEFMFAVLFMFIPCSKVTDCFISTSMLSAMTAGE